MSQGIVGFIYTTAAKYEALTSKDGDALYFLNDGRLYKGSTLLGNNVKLVSEYPQVGENGVIYVNFSNGSTKVWNSSTSSYISITKETTSVITPDSTDDQIPSAKAVYDYVEDLIPADYAELQSQVEQNTKDIEAINDSETGIFALSKEYTDLLKNGQVKTNTDNIESLQLGKADKATTLAGYGITDAYTIDQTEAYVERAIGLAGHLKRKIVDALPAVSSADEHTIYMVPKLDSTSDQQSYDEYMLINGSFERIGDSSADMTDYLTKEEFEQSKTELLEDVDEKITLALDPITINLETYKEVTNAKIAANTEAISAINHAETGILAQAKKYADSLGSNYATKEQGELAESALQESDITNGITNGTISVKGKEVSVTGLGSAAFTSSTAYDAAGSAKAAEDNAKAYANTLLTWQTLE